MLATHLNGPVFIILLILVAQSVVYAFWRKFSLGRLFGGTSKLSDSSSDSAIMAYYSAGHTLISGGRGKLGDMPYSLYATMPEVSSQQHGLRFVEEEVALYALDLPFNTESHFIGLSKDHKLNRLQFESFIKAQNMEKVVLEGDFRDYFDIYATKGQQFQVRYVLDPDAMAVVVDYCRSHFWEINNAELYFVVSVADKGDMSIVEQSQKFVNQIKPALLAGSPGAPVVHHDVPYGEYDGPPLPCPICQKIMAITDNRLLCPDGHGVLLGGHDLMAIHTGQLQIPLQPGTAVDHGPLTCPNCHNSMTSMHYADGPVLIDSCDHCPFRWLDANDLPLLAPKPDN